MEQRKNYPFTAILGQEQMKEALVLNLVNPSLGGVLIRGQKGTAKSTAVRGLADVLPAAKVVELPINATEDRVAGTLDIEHALKTGEKKFEPGILAAADRHILYVDEINLLDDHIVDLLLDAAAMGVNTVEREGISHSHPARFVLVGTMNPEEGNLRPQLLDRFGMVVDVAGETDTELRAQIIENRLAYEEDNRKFCRKYAKAQKELASKIREAKERLPEIKVSHEMVLLAAEIGISLETEGHRADISMIKTAKTMAAFRGNSQVEKEDLKRAAVYTLPHRMRKGPLDSGNMDYTALDEVMKNWEETRDSGKGGTREDSHSESRGRKDSSREDSSRECGSGNGGTREGSIRETGTAKESFGEGG